MVLTCTYLDLDAQSWVSIHGTLQKFIYGTPPNTMEWEHCVQKPFGGQITSTLYGPHLTSELVGYADRVGDYMCEFPLAWLSMHFLEEVRVFEFHGPADWHELCVRYPANGPEDSRLVPNWGAVAEEWGGVHLSFGGLFDRRIGTNQPPDGKQGGLCWTSGMRSRHIGCAR